MSSYSSLDIANYFLSKSAVEKIPITNLKLQKMVYLAHGFYLALTGEPLLKERVEAWSYGPVIEDLYHNFKRFGSGEISTQLPVAIEVNNLPDDLNNIPKEVNFNQKELKALNYTWDTCKKLDPIKLSNWTHIEGSPWKKAWDEGKTFIPDEWIKEYFDKYVTKPSPQQVS